MTENKIKKFNRFLKENNIYGLYYKKYSPVYSHTNNVHEYLRKTPECLVLGTAFSWGQETSFWLDICAKWGKFLNVLNEE